MISWNNMSTICEISLCSLHWSSSTRLGYHRQHVLFKCIYMKWFEPGDHSQDITKPQNPHMYCYSPFIMYRLHLSQISCFLTPLITWTHTFSENFKMCLLVGNFSGSLDTRSNGCYFTGVTWWVRQKTQKLLFFEPLFPTVPWINCL